jgi:hypothetical protein
MAQIGNRNLVLKQVARIKRFDSVPPTCTAPKVSQQAMAPANSP